MKRKKAIITAACLCLILGATAYWLSVPRAVPLSQEEKAHLISHTIKAILNENEVFILDKFGGEPRLQKLYIPSMREKSVIYFINDLNIPDSIFTDFGLVPLPEGERVLLDFGEALITVSESNRFWRVKNAIFFDCSFASLGGYGYAIRIIRSPFESKIVYWLSSVS